MALLSSLCSSIIFTRPGSPPSARATYRHLFAGLTNKSLRELVVGLIPGYSPRQMTYDLRRLRREGLIRRIDGSQAYKLTDHGWRIPVFFTKTYTRILDPSLAERDPTLPEEIAQLSPLARAWRAFECARDARITAAQLTSRRDDAAVNIPAGKPT